MPLSVCASVWVGRSNLKIGRREAPDPGDPWPHLEVERSKVKVTGLINALTENQPHLRKGNACELNFKLGIWWSTVSRIIDMRDDLQDESFGWLFIAGGDTVAAPLHCRSHSLLKAGVLVLTWLLQKYNNILAEDADDTLFRKVRYSSHHLLHTLLPEQTNHPYHLRSRTHSFKLSFQHDERNFIDRIFF